MDKMLLKTLKFLGFRLYTIKSINTLNKDEYIHKIVSLSPDNAVFKAARDLNVEKIDHYTFKIID